MRYVFNPFTGNFDLIGATAIPDPLVVNDLAVNNLLTANHIHGNVAGALYVHVKNTSGVTLAKGTPVYIVGAVGDTTTLEVAAADAANADKTPAIGLLETALDNNQSGHAVMFGEITGFNTASYQINDELYLASGGGLTVTRPTSGHNQSLAVVGRVHATTGTVLVWVASGIPPTDLSYNASTRQLNSSTGQDVTLPLAGTEAGLMAAADKGKLDGIQDGAQVNVATDLSYDAATREVRSSTGADAALPLVSASAAGLAPAFTSATGKVLTDGGWATPSAGSPGGSAGQLQWNNGGAFAGLSTSSIDGSGNLTFSGRWINSTNGAASAPASALTGTWFTGGTATTTKPHFLIEPAGTTSTSWSTFGTGFGLNAPSGFPGNLLDLQVNGNSVFRVQGGGDIVTIANRGISCRISASNGYELNHTGLHVGNQWGLIFREVGGAASTEYTGLYSPVPNTLEQRRTTNAQTYRLYNTFTSATDNERGYLSWSSNVFRIGTEKGSGGGTARAMELQTDGTTRIAISASGGIGFYGAAAAAQPTAIADATDASTVITQLNALLSRLRTIGLIAT